MFSKLKISTYTLSEIQDHFPNTNIHEHTYNFFNNYYMNCPLTWVASERSVWVSIDEVWPRYCWVLSVSVYLYSHLQQLSLKSLSSCLPRSLSFIHSSKLCQGESYGNDSLVHRLVGGVLAFVTNKNKVWPTCFGRATEWPKKRTDLKNSGAPSNCEFILGVGNYKKWSSIGIVLAWDRLSVRFGCVLDHPHHPSKRNKEPVQARIVLLKCCCVSRRQLPIRKIRNRSVFANSN